MRWKVDKSLNWGRKNIQFFARQIPQARLVLDVGAGPGDDLLAIKQYHPSASLHALEYYPPFVQKLESSGIQTHQVNFESAPIPLKDESVDVIISNQVLEHCKEVFWNLHEMARCLQVGGYLMIGVPNLASLHNRFLLLIGQQPTCIQNCSAHVRGFTFADLNRLLGIFPGGFELICRRGANFYPFPPRAAQFLARVFPSMAWGLFLLLKKTKPYDRPYFLEYPSNLKLETNFFLGREFGQLK